MILKVNVYRDMSELPMRRKAILSGTKCSLYFIMRWTRIVLIPGEVEREGGGKGEGEGNGEKGT